MFSLVLDATNNIIRAVMAAPAATNNPQFSSHYADNDGTTFVEGSEGGVLNGTTNVTLVTAPAASTRRIVKSIALYNADTAAVTVNIQYFDGTNARTIANVTLAVGDTWTLEGTFNSSGAMKTTGGGTPGGSTTQVQYNNAGSFGGITNATTDGTTLSMTSPKIITGINDVNGNELLYLVATASAVNELNIANAATGNAPSLTATGGDANVGIQLTPKGTGRTTVTQLTTTSPRVLTAINDTNGNELIGITATASAVNEITVANAATTANPVISATGGDTNIGITLTPKGTGGVTTANCFAVGGATPSTSGAGITFPATQSASTDANTLDDYEEGTFTPTITASGGGSPTYSNQTGIYTKIGRAVSVYLYVGFSKNTLTGNIKINGLPFTIGSGSAINNCQYWYIPGGTNIYSLLAFSGGSNTALDLYKIIAATIDNSGSSFTAADINSAAYLHFNFVYYV